MSSRTYSLRTGAPLLLFRSSGEEIVADHLRSGIDFATSVRIASKYLALLDTIARADAAKVFDWPVPRYGIEKLYFDHRGCCRAGSRCELNFEDREEPRAE